MPRRRCGGLASAVSELRGKGEYGGEWIGRCRALLRSHGDVKIDRPTFFRQTRGQSVIQTPSRTKRMPHRSLQGLVGNVGSSYLRRIVPPVWVLAMTLVASAVLCQLAHWAWPMVAIVAVASTGLLANWAKRRSPGPPGWRTLAVLLATLMLCRDDVGQSGVVRVLLLSLTAGSALHALLYMVEELRVAARLKRCANSLDDAALLDLLPFEAYRDARRWQEGDDSKAAELALAVHLSAMWLSIAQIGEHDATRRTTLSL